MRPQQPVIAARRRLMPWLLLVVALAALGIWSGGHCADHHTATHAAAAIAPDDNFDPVGQAVTGRHNVDRVPDGHRSSSSAAGDCHVESSHSVAASPTGVSAPPVVRAHGRISPQAPPRPTQPEPAGLTLSAIGVSRT
ncbi:hypothetical protein ACIA5D_32750 [Actinoplanes sp. NPDC051513]|uniref:hypothetical protein n=1 Tax=Actinoplanes sp. NPDC051513 TaxID=3363908 RepID=UPI00378BA65C